MKKYQYRAIHTAISTVYGKPSKCEQCKGANKSKRFEWSNKNHKYTLKRKDWWQLCATCHRRYDRQKFGWETWNKGRKGRQPNHNTSGLIGGGWNRGCHKRSKIVCVCGIKFYPPKSTSLFHSKHCAMLGNKRARE